MTNFEVHCTTGQIPATLSNAQMHSIQLFAIYWMINRDTEISDETFLEIYEL